MKAYLSNASKVWPIRRQEELMRAAVPGWPKGCDVSRDILDSQQLMAHRPESLRQLNRLLKPSSFQRPDTILVAAFPVLGWTADDLVKRLAAAAARGFTVRALDIGMEIGPDANAAALQRAMEAFEVARQRVRDAKRGQTGGRLSGERRRAAAAEKVQPYAKLWRDPKETRTDAEIAALAGVSVNTVKAHLGPRYNRVKIKAARAAKEPK
jgi:hypothetical protein